MTIKPFYIYYGFKALDNPYAIGIQIACSCDNENVYVLAATDGKKIGVLISYIGEDAEISINLPTGATVYLVEEEYLLKSKYTSS